MRLRSLIAQAYTPREWLERYRRLSELEQFRLWAQVEPKEVKMDSQSTFRLVIEGLQKQAIDGEIVQHELPEHDPDQDQDKLQ